MAISLRKACGRVFKDELFMPNYTALVVMSFCSGLLYFAMQAKNIPYIFPSAILAFVALIFSEGFQMKYFKSLISEQNPAMPDWKNMYSYGATGIKFMAASIILSMVFTSISFFLIAILLIFGLILKISVPNIVLTFMVIIGAAELLICLCLPAFVYVFTDMDEDVTSFLFLNKIWKYFSCNYFTALFLMVVLASLNAILAVLTVMNIKYILLYIIPLMITPLLRFIASNLMAQAYLADKNLEKGSRGRLFLYLIISIVLWTIVFYIAYKIGSSPY